MFMELTVLHRVQNVWWMMVEVFKSYLRGVGPTLGGNQLEEAT